MMSSVHRRANSADDRGAYEQVNLGPPTSDDEEDGLELQSTGRRRRPRAAESADCDETSDEENQLDACCASSSSSRGSPQNPHPTEEWCCGRQSAAHDGDDGDDPQSDVGCHGARKTSSSSPGDTEDIEEPRDASSSCRRGPPDEHTPPEGTVEVRVLDVKNRGARTSVYVAPNAAVRDLQSAIHEALGVPPAQQRLIASGRPMNADDRLDAFKLGGGGSGDAQSAQPRRAVLTVHLMRRPGRPGSGADAAAAASGGAAADPAATANPLVRASEVDALSAALAIPAEDDATEAARRLQAAHGLGASRAEATVRTASRVRLLSTLLALYCALNALAALTEQQSRESDLEQDAEDSGSSTDSSSGTSSSAATTSSDRTRDVLELALNAGGLWVGFAGLRASKALDLASAERYDRGLRCLAVGMLAYEAYYRVVVPADDGGSNDDDGGGGSGSADSSLADTGGTDEGMASPWALGPESEGNATGVQQPVATPQPTPAPAQKPSHHNDSPVIDDYALYLDDIDVAAAAASADQDAASVSDISRESQIFSGLVFLVLWSAIWLVCVNNSARLRADLAMGGLDAGGGVTTPLALPADDDTAAGLVDADAVPAGALPAAEAGPPDLATAVPLD